MTSGDDSQQGKRNDSRISLDHQSPLHRHSSPINWQSTPPDLSSSSIMSTTKAVSSSLEQTNGHEENIPPQSIDHLIPERNPIKQSTSSPQLESTFPIKNDVTLKRKSNSLVDLDLNNRPGPKRAKVASIRASFDIQSSSDQPPFYHQSNPNFDQAHRKLPLIKLSHPPNPSSSIHKLLNFKTSRSSPNLNSISQTNINRKQQQEQRVIDYLPKFEEILSEALGIEKIQYAKLRNDDLNELPYPEPKHSLGPQGPKMNFDRYEVERFSVSDAFARGYVYFPPLPPPTRKVLDPINSGIMTSLDLKRGEATTVSYSSMSEIEEKAQKEEEEEKENNSKLPRSKK